MKQPNIFLDELETLGIDELYSHYDLFPTFIELLNLPGQVRQDLPGQSFAEFSFLLIMQTYKKRRIVK